MSYYNYNDWNTFNMDEGYLELFDMSQYDPFSGAPADLDRCFLESYPLSRYSSSDGSSPLPAGPASPETHYSFNGDTIQPTVLHPSAPSPYYVDPYTSAPPYQPQEPRRVPSGSKRPRSSTTSSGYTCSHCPPNKPGFKRRADLDRHVRHMHQPASTLSSFPCDYPRCARRHEPFHRRDHFRDHLREFHREDIEKRGVSVDEDWYEGRNTVTSWWRCNRCLGRVHVDKHGFECPVCKGMCCPKRQEVRRR